MMLHRTADGWDAYAPAKLNFFLEVLGRREDGYHEIVTVVCPIGLYDCLRFRNDPQGRIRLTVRCAAGWNAVQASDVPLGRDNLVVRAAELLRERSGIKSGARIDLYKRIPIAAGLGGGSSDAAATLVAANKAWALGWPQEKLVELAAELGSDVPCFIPGGPVVCRGRGEQVEPIGRWPPMWCVVAKPPAGLSTAAVYRACRPADVPNSPNALLEAAGSGDLAAVGRLLWNRLQDSAAKLSPWIERLSACFSQLGCLGHAMTGSGTAYFGVFRHARNARFAARRLSSCGVEVFVVQSCR
jgi:4-diphosphocytidyl-2-C-methyl-D-erythritol kinase